MIKYIIIGIISGGLFFGLWALWKIIFYGVSVNVVYMLPIILVFVTGAAGVRLISNRPSPQ